MKKKYILQIKRGYFWEDVLILYDERQAFNYKLKLVCEGVNCRLVEVIYYA